MKYAHILPVRDKAFAVRETASRIINQQCQPIEIILSDQGSTDGSWDILQELKRDYTGPHDLKIVQCPDTEFKGFAGLNRHFNFIHDQTDADVIIQSSADDLDDITRDAKTIAVFEKFDPSFVGTGMAIANPHMPPHAVTMIPDRHNRWVNVAEAIQSHCFSGVGPAWKRDLYMRMGGLRGIESSDFIIPILALFENGFYYIDEPLYTQVAWASLDNTGVEGQMRQAEKSGDEDEKARIRELNEFHNCYNWSNICRRLTEFGYIARLSQEAQQALTDKIFQRADSWSLARLDLTLRKLDPKRMNA